MLSGIIRGKPDSVSSSGRKSLDVAMNDTYVFAVFNARSAIVGEAEKEPVLTGEISNVGYLRWLTAQS